MKCIRWILTSVPLLTLIDKEWETCDRGVPHVPLLHRNDRVDLDFFRAVLLGRFYLQIHKQHIQSHVKLYYSHRSSLYRGVPHTSHFTDDSLLWQLHREHVHVPDDFAFSCIPVPHPVKPVVATFGAGASPGRGVLQTSHFVEVALL